MKPDNVLLSGRHAFLADFGVARAFASHVNADQTVTGTRVMVGTPAYMAPEQVTGSPVGIAAAPDEGWILGSQVVARRPADRVLRARRAPRHRS